MQLTNLGAFALAMLASASIASHSQSAFGVGRDKSIADNCAAPFSLTVRDSTRLQVPAESAKLYITYQSLATSHDEAVEKVESARRQVHQLISSEALRHATSDITLRGPVDITVADSATINQKDYSSPSVQDEFRGRSTACITVEPLEDLRALISNLTKVSDVVLERVETSISDTGKAQSLLRLRSKMIETTMQTGQTYADLLGFSSAVATECEDEISSEPWNFRSTWWFEDNSLESFRNAEEDLCQLEIEGSLRCKFSCK